ncbi:hypothetical protein BD410DRAFT_622778 [Rickenella mellea]|uniref:Uncharacterized protein n=1 Tax=Rickenella mellea TaxID=50990 RepID=A0A4Y7PM16_9AGAM|nr:hypothetical protein BD410DRAFT_622778 [Rickenella mellea]
MRRNPPGNLITESRIKRTVRTIRTRSRESFPKLLLKQRFRHTSSKFQIRRTTLQMRNVPKCSKQRSVRSTGHFWAQPQTSHCTQDSALGLRELHYIYPIAIPAAGQPTKKSEPGGEIRSLFTGTAGSPRDKHFPDIISWTCGEEQCADISFERQSSDTLTKVAAISRNCSEVDCRWILQDRLLYPSTIATHKPCLAYPAMTLLTIAANALYRESSASLLSQRPIVAIMPMRTTMVSRLAPILSLRTRP